MDPNDALLLSVESILDDDELDNAGRNAALAETVKQFSAFTVAPQTKLAIMKRDDDVEGSAGFVSEHDTSAERARLRQNYEDARRRYPNLSDEDHQAFAWRLLGRGERRKLLEESDTGEDLTFDYEKVDVEKLASFLLDCRSEAIRKAQPNLSREMAFAAACEAKPEIFKVVREARRARLVGAGTEKSDTATVARRFYATQLLTAKANELRKAEPTLSIEAARTDARRRNPEIAARERA
jgi:hypothetical protein